MTKRTLPIARLPEKPSGVTAEHHPKALEKFRPVAAASPQAETTITMFETIGFDWWTGGGVTAGRVAEKLQAAGGDDVTVQINSMGGDYFEGLAIYNLLREYEGKVTVEVLGLAASAASCIAMAGDSILISEAALFFLHNTQWCACGDRHVMQAAADDMEVFDEVMRGLYAARSGASEQELGEMMDRESFLSASRSIELGLADALLDRSVEEASGDEPRAAYRLEALLKQHGVPRAERRRAIKEFCEVKPGADLEGGTPRAAPDGTPGAADVEAALCRLKGAAMGLTL